MTAVPMVARPWHWSLALAGALVLHAGLALVFYRTVEGGTAAVGRGGIEVGLPPAGAAPGAPAEAVAPEAATVAPVKVAEAVPEAAPAVRVPPDAVPLYTPTAPPQAREAEPVEPVEVAKAEPVDAAEAEPVDAVVAEFAMALPPPPKIKPPVPETTPVQAAREPAPASPASVADAAPDATAETVATTEPGPQGAELPGNNGRAGAGARQGTGSAEGHSGGGSPGAVANYKARLLAWLERHKEYPRRAQLRRQEGTATLYFVMGRDGSVLEYRIVESSGHRLLDEEVAAMIERAAPLPTPPDALRGDRLNYIVPVEFRQY